jgi:Na+-driven multidrug efflux pump
MAALLPGLVAYAAASSLSAFFTNHLGRPHWSAAIAGLSLTLNVMVCAWAVPRYGALGAAASTSVAYILAIIAACALFQRLSGQGWAVWRAYPGGQVGGTVDNPPLPVHHAPKQDA